MAAMVCLSREYSTRKQGLSIIRDMKDVIYFSDKYQVVIQFLPWV